MSKVINILANMGSDYSVISDEEIMELTNENQLTDEEVNALINRDHAAIAELLQSRTKVYGILIPAEDDEDDEEEDKEEAVA